MQEQGIIQGSFYLIIAQLGFLASGYLVHIGLGRILGPDSYGAYAIIISIATIFNMFLITGMPQAVAKYCAENRNQARNVLRSSLTITISISAIISMLIILLSPVLAHFFNDDSLKIFIQVISIMIIPYGPLMTIAGYYNGLQDYRTQSLLYTLYNVLKPVLIFIFVYSGFSLWGAVLGFVFSPVIPLMLGLFLVGIFSLLSVDNFSFKKIIAFSLPIMILSAIINLILTLDLFFIKSILVDDQIVGYYSAASQISRIVYFLLLSIGSTIFPAIAACMLNFERIRDYLSESIRYTLMVMIPFIVILVITAKPLIYLIFTCQYAPSVDPLKILLIGMGFFGFFYLLITIISGSNQPYLAMTFSFLVLLIDIGANSVFIPIIGMNGGAWATTIASLIGSGLCLLYLHKKYGFSIEWITLIKIIISTAIVAIFIKFLEFLGMFLILEYLIAFLGYFILLYVFHEIKSKDIARFKCLFS